MTTLDCLHIVAAPQRLDPVDLECLHVATRMLNLIEESQLGIGVPPSDPEARVMQARPPFPTTMRLPAPPWVPTVGEPFRPPADEEG